MNALDIVRDVFPGISDAHAVEILENYITSDEPAQVREELESLGECAKKQVETCKPCGASYVPGLVYDPCLGKVEGVVSACCGHGDDSSRYALSESGGVHRGYRADVFLGEPVAKRPPWPEIDYEIDEVISHFGAAVPPDEARVQTPEQAVADVLISHADENYWQVRGDVITSRITRSGVDYCLGALRVGMSAEQHATYERKRSRAQQWRRKDGNQLVEADCFDKARELLAPM